MIIQFVLFSSLSVGVCKTRVSADIDFGERSLFKIWHTETVEYQLKIVKLGDFVQRLQLCLLIRFRKDLQRLFISYLWRPIRDPFTGFWLIFQSSTDYLMLLVGAILLYQQGHTFSSQENTPSFSVSAYWILSAQGFWSSVVDLRSYSWLFLLSRTFATSLMAAAIIQVPF